MPLNYEIRLNTLNSSSETEHFMVGEGWGERHKQLFRISYALVCGGSRRYSECSANLRN